MLLGYHTCSMNHVICTRTQQPAFVGKNIQRGVELAIISTNMLALFLLASIDLTPPTIASIQRSDKTAIVIENQRTEIREQVLAFPWLRQYAYTTTDPQEGKKKKKQTKIVT